MPSTIEEANEYFESREARANMRSTYRDAIPRAIYRIKRFHDDHWVSVWAGFNYQRAREIASVRYPYDRITCS